mgnify:CR=1 FL=1
MWNLAYIASVSFVMALSGAMMPGPLMAVTVAESARRGPWAGPALMVGHAALELGLLLALMLGMKPLLEREATFAVIAVVGAGALLWMAAGMLRSLPRLSLLTDASGGGGAKLALRGVAYRPAPAARLLRDNLLIYGVGGLIAPFIGIKLIDMLLTFLQLA